MSEQLKARIRRLVDGLNKGNLDAMDEIYAGDCLYHGFPFPDIKGLEAAKQMFSGELAAWPDLRMTIDEIIIEGNTAVACMTYEGTHTRQSPFIPIPPTGKKAVWKACIVAHYVGGKCVEQWEYGDNLGLLQQLGVIPSMG